MKWRKVFSRNIKLLVGKLKTVSLTSQTTPPPHQEVRSQTDRSIGIYEPHFCFLTLERY